MTEQEVIRRLRKAIAPYARLKDAASALKMTPQYLSDVLNGRRAPGPKVLKALNLERTYTEAK